ncbi:unnamed protein product [Symbiodinium natans]|uniref:Uncharacterized protein n=1 Tax=Symbiodinium natans TaxID=878477 RepID=A0A812M6P4_9DINO|nr:unnamed protein product [Symbiodinium natans]
MGNCGLGSWADDEGELTQERLLEAVESMDVDEVERCLNGGVPVNKSIDAKGHTLLDKFAAEHAAMLRDALHYAGTPGEATKLLVEKQDLEPGKQLHCN